jgi:hypothetical protein
METKENSCFCQVPLWTGDSSALAALPAASNTSSTKGIIRAVRRAIIGAFYMIFGRATRSRWLSAAERLAQRSQLVLGVRQNCSAILLA